MRNKLLPFLIALICFSNIHAQVVVNNSNTVQYYVQNVLLGGGVTVSNITYNGGTGTISDPRVGGFTDATSSIGLSAGFLMATGGVGVAQGPNNNTGAGNNLGLGNSSSDPDLTAIASGNLNDPCIIEFDFVPLGDTLRFDYVFASEEYPEYVCSNYNDVFGFFLTGNNPLGGTYNAVNLAKVPTPGVPGSYTNTMVAINTINPGTAGANGSAPNCASIDPNWASYNIYYVSNSGNNYQYDGKTVTLPVYALVNCGETYHIKMAVADVGDGAYDSGVFLEAGSFMVSGGLQAENAVVPNDITLCSQPYTISVNGGPNPPPQSYWDFGDGNTSTLESTTHTYADTGTYTVMYIASSPSACVTSDTAYFNVTIHENVPLTAQINIPPYNPCSPGGLTIDLEFTGSGADSIHWNLGNGTTFVDSTTINYTYTSPGTYPVEFIAFDFDCNVSDTIRDTIYFNPTTTTVNAVVPPNITICGSPLTVNFSSGTPPPPNNFWNFGDGNTSTAIDPSHNYSSIGNYTVMFVAIDSSTCNIADTAFFNVAIAQAPDLNVSIDYVPPVPCETVNYKVNLDAVGTGADSIYWDMGNGVTFIDSTSIDYEYPTFGSYNISVTLFNFFCNQTLTKTMVAEFMEPKETKGIVPNVFTPNGDNWNDKLVFVGVDNTQEFSIKIFNRWGRLMFESDDATSHWDGIDASEGTYFYELKYTDICSTEQKLVTGTVTLLRGPKKQ